MSGLNERGCVDSVQNADRGVQDSDNLAGADIPYEWSLQRRSNGRSEETTAAAAFEKYVRFANRYLSCFAGGKRDRLRALSRECLSSSREIRLLKVAWIFTCWFVFVLTIF